MKCFFICHTNTSKFCWVKKEKKTKIDETGLIDLYIAYCRLIYVASRYTNFDRLKNWHFFSLHVRRRINRTRAKKSRVEAHLVFGHINFAFSSHWEVLFFLFCWVENDADSYGNGNCFEIPCVSHCFNLFPRKKNETKKIVPCPCFYRFR